jgi:hypothetical protein
MTIQVYCELDESCKVFDGHIARKHLERHLAMSLHDWRETDSLSQNFTAWHRVNNDAININPRGAVFLVPQEWFA